MKSAKNEKVKVSSIFLVIGILFVYFRYLSIRDAITDLLFSTLIGASGIFFILMLGAMFEPARLKMKDFKIVIISCLLLLFAVFFFAYAMYRDTPIDFIRNTLAN